MKKKFIFIKTYKTSEGSIPEGSEIVFFRGNIYLNGGLLHPAYRKIIMDIVNNEAIKNQYLIEKEIITNKI